MGNKKKNKFTQIVAVARFLIFQMQILSLAIARKLRKTRKTRTETSPSVPWTGKRRVGQAGLAKKWDLVVILGDLIG